MALPPDPDGMNEARAKLAGIALDAFMAACGAECETAVMDLLCDLRHWCDRDDNSGTFAYELLTADGHYECETQGD